MSKYLTQTFMSHCNEMICQQVTLSGYAEWPKVADAVIKAERPTRKLKLRTPGSPEAHMGFRRSPISLLYPAFSNRPFPNIFTQPLTLTITCPSGITEPFPNAHEIGNLFLTNSLTAVRIWGTPSRMTALLPLGWLADGEAQGRELSAGRT